MKSLEMEAPESWRIHIFAVDDGSTDKTFEILHESKFEVSIARGDGDWYWAKSMSVAEEMAYQSSAFDYLLWVNDDTVYLKDALIRVENFRKENPASIVVGNFLDPETGNLSYGGLKKIGNNPFKYVLSQQINQQYSCDNFHGNFVLVPKAVAETVGRIDGSYDHAYADYDYGCRATRLGVQIVAITDPIGTCPENKIDFAQIDTLAGRLSYVFGKKGLPIRSQVRFLRKFGPVFWIRYLVQPYIRAIFGLNSRAKCK
jgi:GT2 family glycosyltransferase